MPDRIPNMLKSLVAGLCLLLLAASANGQQGNVVYEGEIFSLSVVADPGHAYRWKIFTDHTLTEQASQNIAEFIDTQYDAATRLIFKRPGVYFFEINTISPFGCSNQRHGMVTVLEAMPTALILPPDSICIGETGTLTVEFTGTAPWTLQYSDGTSVLTIDSIVESPHSIVVMPMHTTFYQVISVANAMGRINNTPGELVELFVKPRPITSPIYRYTPPNSE